MGSSTPTLVQKRRFDVHEYHRMGETGILAPQERVELFEGEILAMTPIGNRHAACVKRLNHILNQVAANTITVGIQDPIRLDVHTEVQPDVLVLKHREDFYAAKTPGPSDSLLIIEVADTSLAYDQGRKLAAYARAGVPEVWVADLQSEAVHVYSDPEEAGYRVSQRVERGGTLSPTQFEGPSIAVDFLLG